MSKHGKYDEYAEMFIGKFEDDLIGEERLYQLLEKIHEWKRKDDLIGGEDS